MSNGGPADVQLPRTDLAVADATLSAAAVDAFVGALGGRQSLVAILLIGAGDPAVDRVVALLDDPEYAGRSLPWLCQYAGLTVADFLKAYQRAMIARGEIAATKVIADRVIAVVEDVMRRAAPYDEPCACAAMPCLVCGGTRVKRILPDLDRQKIALQLGKLLTPGGLVVQQNTQITQPAGATPVGSLAELQAAVGDLLRPRRALPAPVVEARADDD